MFFFFFFKQKTAYELRISDWSSDVCSSDLVDPIAGPEIGKVGVSLSNLSEMELLFDGIDLGGISTSFTINGTAAIIYAMYVACADKQGVPRDRLTGTIQNDIRSEEHTSELQSLMRISYAVFCLKKNNKTARQHTIAQEQIT